MGQQKKVDNRSVLSKRPRTVYFLWQEYEFGITGKKAAKLYSIGYRGRNNHAYCLQKPCWDLVVSMIFHGYNHNKDIDKIYAVYRNLLVVLMLWLIRRDSRSGKHDELSNFVTLAEVKSNPFPPRGVLMVDNTYHFFLHTKYLLITYSLFIITQIELKNDLNLFEIILCFHTFYFK